MPRNLRLEWEEIYAIEILSKAYERYQRTLEAFLLVASNYKEGDYSRILKTVNMRVDLLESRKAEPMSKAEEWFQKNTKSNGESKEEE